MFHILLDIDGVLTSETHTQKCVLENRPENLYWMDWFDPECIEALRTLLKRTGADIIVSSSWREMGIERLRTVWEHNKMPGQLKEPTPEWIPDKMQALRHWINSNTTLHPFDKYIILDDDPTGLERWQIKTNPRTGLTRQDVEKKLKTLHLRKGPRM